MIKKELKVLMFLILLLSVTTMTVSAKSLDVPEKNSQVSELSGTVDVNSNDVEDQT